MKEEYRDRADDLRGPCDESFAALKKAEVAWSKAARERSPEGWKSAVDRVHPMATRIHAACVVWWDYFGSRMTSDGWNHLDAYKAKWTAKQRVRREEVRKALELIGYPAHLASARASQDANDEAKS